MGKPYVNDVHSFALDMHHILACLSVIACERKGKVCKIKSIPILVITQYFV